jgi:hypothetical protein
MRGFAENTQGSQARRRDCCRCVLVSRLRIGMATKQTLTRFAFDSRLLRSATCAALRVKIRVELRKEGWQYADWERADRACGC